MSTKRDHRGATHMFSPLAASKATAKDKPYMLSDDEGLHLLVSTEASCGASASIRRQGEHDVARGLSRSPRSKRPGTSATRSKGRSQPASINRAARSWKASVPPRRIPLVRLQPSIWRTSKREGATEAILNKNRRMLEDLASSLRNRPITEITAAELLDLLKKIEKSGRRERARRLRGAIGSVRLAIATLRAETDPTYSLRGALLRTIVKRRAAITDEKDLGVLLGLIGDYDG